MDPKYELARRVENYKRHKDYNPRTLEKVLEQVDGKGVSYVLSAVSDEAREVHLKSRQVGCECHRAVSYLRFQESGDCLVTKAEFEHDIIEGVMNHFTKRFPRNKIVIIQEGVAYVGFGDKIIQEDPSTYLKTYKKQKPESDELWNRFYDSQYIPARRNRKLAMKAVPKKLWKRFDIPEGEKIDKGIEAVTLLEYI
jgi:probable DNA metabolism protein